MPSPWNILKGFYSTHFAHCIDSTCTFLMHREVGQMPGTNRWEEAPLVTAYPTLILKDTDECTGKKYSSKRKVATCLGAAWDSKANAQQIVALHHSRNFKNHMKEEKAHFLVKK
jgi:hypothetical protein